MNQEQRQLLISQISELPGQIESLVAPLSPDELGAAYRDGEWSVAQNVHHLFDAHANGYIRFKLVLTEEHPTLKPYDQDAWAILADAASTEIGVSLRLLSDLHSRWVAFLQSVPESAWARTGYHPEHGIVSLDDLLESYASHGLAHVEQIQTTLAAR